MPQSSPAAAPCQAACPLATAATIDRRVFLSHAAFAAAAAALAACGGGGSGGSDGPTAPAVINSTVSVASYPALAAVGGVATVTLNGSRVAIVRTGASSFITLSLSCPHQGTTLDVTSSGFHCPNHGATFNSTGVWVGGQRASNMSAYATSYDAATGTLTIA